MKIKNSLLLILGLMTLNVLVCASIEKQNASNFEVLAKKALVAAKIQRLPEDIQAGVAELQARYDLALKIYNDAQPIVGTDYKELVSLGYLLKNFGQIIKDLKKKLATAHNLIIDQRKNTIDELVHQAGLAYEIMIQAAKVASDAHGLLIKLQKELSISSPSPSQVVPTPEPSAPPPTPQPIVPYTAPQPIFPRPTNKPISK